MQILTYGKAPFEEVKPANGTMADLQDEIHQVGWCVVHFAHTAVSLLIHF
jgi:hypothetical protein